MADPTPPPDDVVSPRALRIRLVLIAAIAVVVGVTVGVIQSPGDGALAGLGTGLAGACFLLLFQPPTASRGNREDSAAIGFGSATGQRRTDRPLNRAERRAQEREARRLAKKARKGGG